MFQQRPMPPMNNSRFFPPGRQMPMRGQPFGRQMPFQPVQSPRSGGGLKGILSRILPGNKGMPGGNTMFGAQEVSNAVNPSQGLKGIATPANISNILGNVQRVLGMAQQVTPIVQQYGPLVKNLPAMWKIYRELQNNDDETENSNESDNTSNDDETKDSKESAITSNNDEEKSEFSSDTETDENNTMELETSEDAIEKEIEYVQPPVKKGRSTPKMYI
ncbi:VrrA/YqfQ family protein [Metabacillus fastidiosus]|uniref:VrrA/YqfQ family protein n=1 Tax=Metabacillus fastidiosus TaxID=1458 RepID=A0ABU6NUY8_9BACI|nr:VrrA/YqfQ family protein [Metabacillus fastidiosus]